MAVLEALRDVRVDREIIRLPRWIGTETTQLVGSILKGVGGSWKAGINGYQFPRAGISVLARVLEGTPRPPGNRLATFETPDALAEKMRALASVTEFDHVLEPSAGRGRLIALPLQEQITAIEIDAGRAAKSRSAALARRCDVKQSALPVLRRTP